MINRENIQYRVLCLGFVLNISANIIAGYVQWLCTDGSHSKLSSIIGFDLSSLLIPFVVDLLTGYLIFMYCKKQRYVNVSILAIFMIILNLIFIFISSRSAILIALNNRLDAEFGKESELVSFLTMALSIPIYLFGGWIRQQYEVKMNVLK